MSVAFIEHVRSAGEPTPWASMLEDVLDNTPEATWSSTREEAISRMTNACNSIERVEIAAISDETLIGFVAMALDEDCNVGLCLSLLWYYVTPAYRSHAVGKHFMRRAVHYAKVLNCPTLSYTHRRGEGRFELVYRRIKHG